MYGIDTVNDDIERNIGGFSNISKIDKTSSILNVKMTKV